MSAVIYNRLKQGMPLQIDATIRYYTNNWTRQIKQSELSDDEPYNLSLNRDLPPTPIGNPGLASMKAAAKPSKKSYLYYVRKANDKSGEHAFSLHRRAVRQGPEALPRLAERQMIRLGVCGWPVAHSRSPQMHNAALAQLGPEHLALPAAPDPAAPLRRDRQSAARRRLQGRQRDDPAQGGGARARRHGHGDRAERSARPTRSRSSDGRIHADNTDATGFLSPLKTSVYEQDRAGARRRRLRPRRRLRAQAGRRARDPHLEPHPRARAGARGRVRRHHRRRTRRDHRQLHVDRPARPVRDVQGSAAPRR